LSPPSLVLLGFAGSGFSLLLEFSFSPLRSLLPEIFLVFQVGSILRSALPVGIQYDALVMFRLR
jgi:hypothetical protein